jgi:hypothetical protein
MHVLKRALFTAFIAVGFLMVSPQQANASTRQWVANGDGSVNVSWPQRSGQCTIHYTESDQRMYKYQTVVPCSEGSLRIGALVSGRSYRFRVNASGEVAKAVVGKARRAAVNTSAQQIHAARLSPAETLSPSVFKPTAYRSCNSQGEMQTTGPLNHDERKSGRCGTGGTNLRVVKGPERGSITLHWNASEHSMGQYHVTYGTESGVYTMGALNVGGESQSFTVHGLESGKRYYFKLWPVHQDGRVAGTTWEVSGVAR